MVYGWDDRFLNSEVRVASFGGCLRGLESDLTKGGIEWSEDETQMIKVICELVMKANKFVA